MLVNLRYICAQPATTYYSWQVEVMINNFIKNGINPNNIDIVCSLEPTQNIPNDWGKLRNHYNYVRFFFYHDTRQKPCYISSIRPNILKQHFAAHPYLKDEAIFYHDCDMVFTKPVDWGHLLTDDTWYLSDTRFYIGTDYIKSKKYGIYERMCEIVGIDEAIPAQNELDSGGAQYIMKNIDDTFWEKVERDSEKLYQFFLDHLKAFPTGCLGGYHPIQKWTADMWAVLWNAWYFGHKTIVHKDLEFVWATQEKRLWDSLIIYHNAGITSNEADKYFYKGEYINKLPYNIENIYSSDTATHMYVNEILETAQRSCLI
jgi:hypothetical protein